MKEPASACRPSEIDRLATCYRTDRDRRPRRLGRRAGRTWSARRVRTGGRRPGVHRRRLPRIRPHDAEQGRHGHERMLSRPSVEAMTTDQSVGENTLAFSSLGNRGWGFGLSSSASRRALRRTGPVRLERRLRYVAYSIPGRLVGILMTQRFWDSPSARPCCPTSGPPPTRRSTPEWRGPGDHRRRQM